MSMSNTLVTHRLATIRAAAVVATFIVSTVASTLATSTLRAEEPASKGLERWLPEDVIAFAKLDDPGEIVRRFLGSNLRKQLEALDAYNIIKSDAKLRRGLERLEQAESDAGRSVLEVADDIAGKEVIVGLRLSFPPSVLVIARSESAKRLQKGLETIKDAVRNRHGFFPDSAKTERHGYTVENIDEKVAFCVKDDMFFVSNNQRAVEDMLELAAGKSERSVANSEWFGAAFEGTAQKNMLVTAAVRPSFIPSFAIPEKADNVLGSLLVSGWLETLRVSETLAVRAHASGEGLGIEILSESRSGKVDPKVNSTFFPTEGATADQAELAALEKAGFVGLLHLRRDIAGWWQKRSDWLNERRAGELLQANNFLSIFFGGRNFQDEVLPDIGHGVTIVSRRLDYDGMSTKPQPQVPGFAAIFRLKDPEKLSQAVTSAFYQIITLINVDRGNKGKSTPFVFSTEKVGDVDVTVAALNVRDEDRAATPGIEFNFSPSVAVAGSRVIIGSNREMTRELIEALDAKTSPTTVAARAVDLVTLHAAELKELMTVNFDFLANTMVINDGISSDEARARLGAIGQIVDLFESVSVRSRQEGTIASFQIDVALSSAARGLLKPKSTAPDSKAERQVEDL